MSREVGGRFGEREVMSGEIGVDELERRGGVGEVCIHPVRAVARGHAGGLEAIHQAAQLVSSTTHQACDVGGGRRRTATSSR